MRPKALPFALALLIGSISTALTPSRAAGQGCEPTRFTSPVRLGSAGDAYLLSQEWQVTLGYRRLYSNQFFRGSQETSSAPPPVIQVHTAIVDVAYSFNPRVRARLTVPFSTGSFSRIWADNAWHTQHASGIGDISLMGEAWLRNPRPNPRANVSVGLGVKAPTGSNTRPSQVYTASGSVDYYADQPIQPGDGGWGILAQIDAFRQMSDRLALYGFGSYMINPKGQTNVATAPPPAAQIYWSVPDVYSVRTGVAFEPLEQHAVSTSLGARVDGTPVHDLMGGGDVNTIKRTFYVVYADPGLSYTHNRHTFALSVPYRLKVNRMKSLTEQQTGSPNQGGFAKYLVFASYSRRF